MKTQGFEEFRELDWSEEQKVKLGEAFSHLGEILYECKDHNKLEEIRALWSVYYKLERIVTAIGIKQLREKLGNE